MHTDLFCFGLSQKASVHMDKPFGESAVLFSILIF